MKFYRLIDNENYQKFFPARLQYNALVYIASFERGSTGVNIYYYFLVESDFPR